jgi:hypothetical protein
VLQYVGIADCHGLESFLPWTNLNAVSLLQRDKTSTSLLASLQLRASANRHRHAVLYRAELDKIEAECIEKLLNKGEYKEALIYLKAMAKVTEVERHFSRSWQMIPDDKLDPYWSK